MSPGRNWSCASVASLPFRKLQEAEEQCKQTSPACFPSCSALAGSDGAAATLFSIFPCMLGYGQLAEKNAFFQVVGVNRAELPATGWSLQQSNLPGSKVCLKNHAGSSPASAASFQMWQNQVRSEKLNCHLYLVTRM